MESMRKFSALILTARYVFKTSFEYSRACYSRVPGAIRLIIKLDLYLMMIHVYAKFHHNRSFQTKVIARKRKKFYADDAAIVIPKCLLHYMQATQ